MLFVSVLAKWTVMFQISTLDKQPHSLKSDSFVASLCLRIRYVGEITGMLIQLEGKSEEEKDVLIDKLIQGVRKACRDKDNEAHRNALWRATAMLVNTPGIHLSRHLCCLNF